jgi:endonuclease/exonuclease/phosphatase family metal-dependent hydrolase
MWRNNPSLLPRRLSVTVTITRRGDNEAWSLTGVYGPQSDNDKILFIEEIRQLSQSVPERWLLFGDFNLIYRESDKSNDRINRRLMNTFRALLDEIEVKEMHLNGRRYTWSSGTQNPTQTKIDHVFTTKEWELLYPHCHLQAASTMVSDHCPMVLTCAPFQKR